MKSFLLLIVAVIVVLAAVLVFIASRQPDTFQIERSTTIDAPAAAVFAQVNDFHNWQAWSPWAELDPNVVNTYAGPAYGQGASLTWRGNRKTGEGTMTILESRPGQLVRIQLEFRKPLAASNVAEFTFVPEGAGTRVTWSMSGRNNFMFKALHSVMNMDKMVGPDFERGLLKLKTLTEAAAPASK